jgi:hypothetical protein
MHTETEKKEKLSFKDYYNSLTESEKAEIVKNFVPKYMSIATFYYRMRMDNWTEYDFEKMEEITSKNFRHEN